MSITVISSVAIRNTDHNTQPLQKVQYRNIGFWCVNLLGDFDLKLYIM